MCRAVLAVLQAKSEGPLRTGGDGCAAGGGEQAAVQGEAGLGTRDTEASVSARKRVPVEWSLMKTRWPRRTALTPPGDLSVPSRSGFRRSCRSCHSR